MSTNSAVIVGARNLSIFHNGGSYTVQRSHPSFELIKKALGEKDYDRAIELIDVEKAATEWVAPKVQDNSDFRFDNGVVTYNGFTFPEVVSKKVLAMMSEGLPADPLLNFLRRVRLNPSATAQRELLLFCEANDFQITEDGFILAYKKVRGDYNDVHSGRFNNKVGMTHEMNRGDVDDNRDRTCSYGFHFAALEYAEGFGGSSDPIMVLKIDPKDVVSIPSDYKNQKGRTCKYEVIAELTNRVNHKFREVYRGSQDEFSSFRAQGETCSECNREIFDEWDHDYDCSQHPEYDSWEDEFGFDDEDEWEDDEDEDEEVETVVRAPLPTPQNASDRCPCANCRRQRGEI